MGGIFMSKRKEIKTEEKVHIVKACICGSISISGVAKRVGVHHSVVDDWVHLYEAEGVEAFLHLEGNRRYAPTLKEAAVKDSLSGEDSLRDICRKYKIRDKNELRSWIKVYNSHKDFKKQTGGSQVTKGRETTQAKRITVAKECISNGKNYEEVAIKYQVSYQQARSWTLKYIEGGESALEDRRGQRKKDQQPRTELEQAQIEIEQLKHKLRLLEVENHLLKNWRRLKGGDAEPDAAEPYLSGNQGTLGRIWESCRAVL